MLARVLNALYRYSVHLLDVPETEPTNGDDKDSDDISNTEDSALREATRRLGQLLAQYVRTEQGMWAYTHTYTHTHTHTQEHVNMRSHTMHKNQTCALLQA